MSAVAGVDERYPFEISDGEPWQIDMRPAIENIVRDVVAGQPVGVIAARFHNTVAAIVVEVCTASAGSRRAGSRVPERRHVSESVLAGTRGRGT